MIFGRKQMVNRNDGHTHTGTKKLVVFCATLLSPLLSCGSAIETNTANSACGDRTEYEIEQTCLPTQQWVNHELDAKKECAANKEYIEAELGLLSAFREQAKHDPKLNISGIEASAYAKIAVAYLGCDDYDNAGKYAEKSLKVLEISTGLNGSAEAYFSLAKFSLYSGDMETAKKHAEKSLELAEKAGKDELTETILKFIDALPCCEETLG